MSAGRRSVRCEARPEARALLAPERSDLEQRRTARLVLRRPCADDLDWMTALHSDPRNYPHAPDQAHDPVKARGISQTLLDGWETDPVGYWIAEPSGELGGATRAVAGTSSGTARELVAVGPERLGMAGVRPSRLAGRPCFNLYFRFVVAVRGQGFAAEASREALIVADGAGRDIAYDTPRATHSCCSRSIASAVISGNSASARAADRRSRIVTARPSSAKRPSQRTAARS
jgi:hypothetical protein